MISICMRDGQRLEEESGSRQMDEAVESGASPNRVAPGPQGKDR